MVTVCAIQWQQTCLSWLRCKLHMDSLPWQIYVCSDSRGLHLHKHCPRPLLIVLTRPAAAPCHSLSLACKATHHREHVNPHTRSHTHTHTHTPNRSCKRVSKLFFSQPKTTSVLRFIYVLVPKTYFPPSRVPDTIFQLYMQ